MSELKINVVYEDSEVLVINKPAGLVVHGDGRTEETTLADWLVAQYPDIKEVGESWANQKGEAIMRHGIVHRLDRETSGVMVIAKTQESFVSLKEQFQKHLVQKTYHAFVYDTLKDDEGEIERPIGKSKNDFRKWSAQPGSRGVKREAYTAWERRGVAIDNEKKYSLVVLRPTTGRTHQLRVHLKAIHHPIVCDQLYAPNRECALGFSRLALHAHTLAFTTAEGKEMVCEAPFPKDFQKALERVDIA